MIGEVAGDPLIGIALGLGLGARHAFEPDHLAAVSVLAADGPSPKRGALIGALWGTGHTLALLACALAVAAAAAQIPPRLTDVFEICVAAMLVVLGARAIYRARPARHLHVVRHPRAIRPLIVGAVHGLAGSGALTALVMTHLPSTGARLSFMLLFGLGSVAAMSAISGAAGWPLARLARRPATSRFVFAVVGAASMALGIAWAWLPVQRIFQ
ncbi:MAG TPA: hypothetical protein VIQ54_01865 [Polyangia bacterium]|jgi:hypothetical protein